MSDIIQKLIKEHEAYYEVLPYYVVIEARHGSPGSTQRIHAGFDIDVYGNRIENVFPSKSPEYALAYAELKKIVGDISHHFSYSCPIEVIPFLSNIFFDTKNHFQPLAMLRIRVSRHGDPGEPVGPAEERALKEIEKQLHQLGLRSGK